EILHKVKGNNTEITNNIGLVEAFQLSDANADGVPDIRDIKAMPYLTSAEQNLLDNYISTKFNDDKIGRKQKTFSALQAFYKKVDAPWIVPKTRGEILAGIFRARLWVAFHNNKRGQMNGSNRNYEITVEEYKEHYRWLVDNICKLIVTDFTETDKLLIQSLEFLNLLINNRLILYSSIASTYKDIYIDLQANDYHLNSIQQSLLQDYIFITGLKKREYTQDQISQQYKLKKEFELSQ
ncbi:MAG: hypothetical protein JW841_14615, partial [Deltaproteobacteria bacterium]|nr:hypothetical protein [Deltaproteobacteria bacterium]